MSAPRRKPKKALLQVLVALVLAIGLGGVAIFVTYTLITGATQQAEQQKAQALAEAKKKAEEAERLARELAAKQKEKFKEVQAVRDINVGETITRDMLELVETDIKPGPMAILSPSEAVGKSAMANLIVGEQLTREKVSSVELLRVPEGMRAMSIPVDTIGNVSGNISVGSYIDILTVLKDGDQSLAKTILQNVQVIAMPSANSVGGSQHNKESALTLAVKPKDAERLILAGSMGKFHLTLRNFKDRSINSLKGMDTQHLLTGKDPAASSKASLPALPKVPEPGLVNVNYTGGSDLPAPGSPINAEKRYKVEIYKGSVAESKDFDY